MRLSTQGFDGRVAVSSNTGGKKSGPKVVTLNRHSRPRLPGSVVGEPSMRSGLNSGKITEVSDRKFPPIEAIS